jgi:serine/threonine protein kinase
VLHDSRATLLYRVTDQLSGQQLVLKTLRPERADDADEIRALIMEEWRGRRIVSPFFAQLRTRRRTQLPLLPADLARGRDAAADARRRSAFHRRRRRPARHAPDEGARPCTASTSPTATSSPATSTSVATVACASSTSASPQPVGRRVSPGSPGTPSYMAPELFAGERAGPAHDLYAAGVTLYHLLTRKYPYGEIEPFQHPKFGEPVAPTRYRPDIPGWLENVLLKAVARDPAQRFETAEEFLLALERGANRRSTGRR